MRGGTRRRSLNAESAAAAVIAQAELAATSGICHRVKPVDLLIASMAATQDLGVLHYDHDYDTIVQHLNEGCQFRE